MAADLEHPDLEDPFADCSVLSLLPRTLEVHLHVAPALSAAQEEEAIRNIFKSMALKGSKEFLEQAQQIKKSCSNFPVQHSNDGDKAIAATGKDRPQGRRPALGRKRAQFSLKPISSHSVPNVDFDSGIDHIEDPEEYFFAFEQLENADKELKKLRGEVSTDLLQQHQSATARKRRPGILGKTASYRHHFPAKVDTAVVFKESQEEISDKRTYSPSNTPTVVESSDTLHPRTVDQLDTSQFRQTNSQLLDATERQGSVTDKEKKVNDLLDKLLFSFKDLDEDEGATLLRESLQIKSIDVGKVHLPELHGVQKNDIKALDSSVMRKELEGCQLSQNSPTLARNQLAAISALKRRISLKDPYSVLPIDGSPTSRESSRSKGRDESSLLPAAHISHHDRNGSIVGDASASVMVNDKRLSLVDNLHTTVSEADRTVASKITVEEELTEYSSCLLKNATEQNHNKLDNGKDASAGIYGHMEEEENNMQLDALVSDKSGTEVEDRTCGSMDPIEREGLTSPHGSDMPQNHGGSDVDANLHGPDDNLQDEATIPAQEEVVVGAEASKDNSSLPTTVLPMDVQSESAHGLLEENNERQGLQEASGAPQNEEKRQKALRRKQNRKKLTSRRQSLADAGMTWKSGIRRSTRIRSRPLQYWCGERFLYGRIHDSLATVIGVKYASPGNPALKVKSFVSEDYADLVAQAGLH
ncbi:centromere protein C [Phoenix dactylifera]|uniref:Centromere protein C n=1 Tax=Phoenix dactylifera TaxID=42345 RepID=A0A8B7CY94_PHODC|nr:centromere protein C [Phoenix dactylifera]